MTATIRELTENLKHYPIDTKILIQDVNDEEFAIVDFTFADNCLTITIGEKEEEEEEE